MILEKRVVECGKSLYRSSNKGKMSLFIPCSLNVDYKILCKSLPYPISLHICRMKVSLRSPSRRRALFKLLGNSLSCISLLAMLSLCFAGVLILLLIYGIIQGSILPRRVSLVVPWLISIINDLSKI